MEAIEAVVRKHGVAGLSIEAVAREAGISKSSVVYDFKSKAELLSAFVRIRLDRKQKDLQAAASAHEGAPNCWLNGMLDHCRKSPTEEDISCAMAITTSLATGDTERAQMGQSFLEDLARITAEAHDPDRARVVWLALHGLLSLEYLGFHKFPPDERDRILSDIAALLTDYDP